MTRFTVIFKPQALGELAEAYLAAADRNGVVAAESEICSLLERRPSSAGRELHEGLREIVVAPLRMLFSASEPDRKVEIETVRLLPGEARADRHGSNGRSGD